MGCKTCMTEADVKPVWVDANKVDLCGGCVNKIKTAKPKYRPPSFTAMSATLDRLQKIEMEYADEGGRWIHAEWVGPNGGRVAVAEFDSSLSWIKYEGRWEFNGQVADELRKHFDAAKSSGFSAELEVEAVSADALLAAQALMEAKRATDKEAIDEIEKSLPAEAPVTPT